MPDHYRKLPFLLAALAGAIVLLIALWSDAQGDRAGLPTGTEDPHASKPAPSGDGAPPRRRSPTRDLIPTQPGAPARLHGLVSGRYGGIWGIRVVALAAGTERVLQETGTGTDGRYELKLDAPVRLDVRVIPGPATKLDTVAHEGLFLEPGEQREIDFPLASGSRVRAQLRTTDGTALGYPFIRMRVIAVPLDALGSDATRVDLHPARLGRVPREGCYAVPDGHFELTGLSPGKWRLLLDSDHSMFASAAIVHGDVDGEVFEVVSACSFLAVAEHLLTEERVPDVTARVEVDGRPLTGQIDGENGVLVCRIPARGMDRSKAMLVLDAPGYRTARQPFPIRTGQRIDMMPDVEPNVTLTFKYEDGRPYTGPLEANLVRDFGIELIASGPGRYRLAIPSHECTLTVSAPDSPFRPEARFDLPAARPLHFEVPVESTGSLSVTLLSGGGVERAELALHRDPNHDHPTALLARRDSGQFDLEPGKALLLDSLPPGRYWAHICTPDEQRWWSADIFVQAGERAVLVAPALQGNE